MSVIAARGRAPGMQPRLMRTGNPEHSASGSRSIVLHVIDRYLLRQILATCLVMTAIGVIVLLLERVLYLFSLVANPSNALSYVGQMLLLLMPHYLSIALPAAFFFGVLLTFGRLKQDGEFVVLMAAGSAGCWRRWSDWPPS